MMNNSTTIEEVRSFLFFSLNFPLPSSPIRSQTDFSLPRLPLLPLHLSSTPQIRRSASQNITPRPPSPFAILLFWRARLPSPPSDPHNPNDNPSNPFRFKHWYTNFGRMLCRPALPSWMDFDKEVERRRDGREDDEEGIGMRERQQQGVGEGGEKWRE